MIRTKKHDDLMKLVDLHAAAEVRAYVAFDSGRDKFTEATNLAKEAREAVVKYLDDNFQAWSMPDLD